MISNSLSWGKAKYTPAKKANIYQTSTEETFFKMARLNYSKYGNILRKRQCIHITALSNEFKNYKSDF